MKEFKEIETAQPEIEFSELNETPEQVNIITVEPHEPKEPQEPKKRKYNKSGKYSKKQQENGTENTEKTIQGNVIKAVEENPDSDDFFKDYKQETETAEMPEPEKKFYANYVSGYLFLICIDAVFPELMIQIFSLYDKKFKQINSKDLKLEKDEIKELEPLADEVVKELFGTMNPTSQFLFAITFLYGGKLMIHRASL